MNKFARFSAIAATAVIGIGALTACTSGTDTPTATTTVTATPTPAAPLDRQGGDYSGAESVFIETYESEYGALNATDEAALLDVGYGTCDALTAGASIEDIFNDLYDGGLTLDEMEEAGFVAGSAVVAFCPEFTEDMMDFANEATGGEFV